jgi:small-conductance mechanosensitive channel
VAIIYVFALVACYPYLPGSDSDAFKGITVLIGLMISLGGSGVINQAMSGLVLMYTRAHQVGDYVRIGETEGVVTALDMLATKIRTNKREEVTIPNSVVLGTATKNFTRLAGTEGVILHTSVTIGYSAPWRKVHEILIEAANRTDGLKQQPPAFVVQTALSDFYVEYQINAHLEKPETRMAVLGKLHSNIQDTFNEAGIAIVSPHYESDPPNPMPAASTV